jgi:hypothetical protein
MNQERARRLAIAIIDEFEDLLAEKDILIPSADRQGREEEACIYGSEYWRLEDTITDVLAKALRKERKRARERMKGRT